MAVPFCSTTSLTSVFVRCLSRLSSARQAGPAVVCLWLMKKLTLRKIVFKATELINVALPFFKR